MEEYKLRPSARARELLEGFLVEYGLAPGDRLPSERALSQRWGLSRSTLRNALSLMEEDGTLRSRIGAGTFVAPVKYTRSLQGLLSMSSVSCGTGAYRDHPPAAAGAGRVRQASGKAIWPNVGLSAL